MKPNLVAAAVLCSLPLFSAGCSLNYSDGKKKRRIGSARIRFFKCGLFALGKKQTDAFDARTDARTV